MGDVKWYKRDPDAALQGMFELTLEERGAYNTVLDLIYTRANDLPDDDRWIAGWLRVDVRVWKRIRNRLIDAEKIYIEAGTIRNKRADVEVLAALSRVASARDAGQASARSKAPKSNSKSNENRQLSLTPVEAPVATGVATTHNHTHSSIVESSDSTCATDELLPAHVVEIWNETAAAIGRPSIKRLSDSRRQLLKQRIRQHGVEDFQRVFASIRASPFLRGELRWAGATFDWTFKQANFQKILEGNYDDG